MMWRVRQNTGLNELQSSRAPRARFQIPLVSQQKNVAAHVSVEKSVFSDDDQYETPQG